MSLCARYKTYNKVHVQFLSRDAYALRSADYAVSRCLSVRPSVTRRNGESYQSFFSIGQQDSKRDGNIPTRTPLTGGFECKGYEKITIFDQYLTLSQK